MSDSVRFYQRSGFELQRGGAHASFSTFRVGEQHINLRLVNRETPTQNESLVIFFVDDVDAKYQSFLDAGLMPDFEPRDAPWGERYFHICDPYGNTLSFARPIAS
ncbi:VOC family protein [Rhodopirellula sp. ICT_H3.1]|uniref:VOC family protein n=2 Tax=Aporhodopirellula aestuarii TaxID=2950107 RepID=A0ABT0UBA7_9BACT|nr:VOC family protein [Aporhodopirellula aestuarii]